MIIIIDKIPRHQFIEIHSHHKWYVMITWISME